MSVQIFLGSGGMMSGDSEPISGSLTSVRSLVTPGANGRVVVALKKNGVAVLALVALFVGGCNDGASSDDFPPAPEPAACTALAGKLNSAYSTITSAGADGSIPSSSGVMVHSIHGPGTGQYELNMTTLNAMAVDAGKTCGDFLSSSVFLPWCGTDVVSPLQDFSSWSYLRKDTLMQGRALNSGAEADEVDCHNANNQKYGLIFDNGYMNQSQSGKANLGCVYPMDGGTGNRSDSGCGVSQETWMPQTDSSGQTIKFGACAADTTAQTYLTEFNHLLTADGGSHASYAGSLTCSLAKNQFNVWVDVRKQLDLSHTDYPYTEFVLWNWNTYSSKDLATNAFLIGFYYLTGCSKASAGNAQDAQSIADLYQKWTGVDVPVVQLSNQAMRTNNTTPPFSCPPSQ